MSLPLLEYAPSSQNQRVAGFEVPGDEQAWAFSTDAILSAIEMDAVIQAAYRQILNEQQMTSSSRIPYLESQLRSGQITVREFIRGLATSEIFRTRNYDTNNNYRFVQMCIQRLLGREVYNDREKFAWSTVLATKGLNSFINELLESEEYLTNFGDHTVPFQRRRVVQQRTTGDLPFARMARYDEFHLAQLPKTSAYAVPASTYRVTNIGRGDRWTWQQGSEKRYAQIWYGIILASVGFLSLPLLGLIFGW
ncbi:MAG: phycobilisome rod-core linker polypeptide CpcG [Alkalinema sp. CACIAM 70d]|nr:MAG: phycobilisome rod-core linker polypeptide CpcG [Alkalinema sp. CACIAM 70d]